MRAEEHGHGPEHRKEAHERGHDHHGDPHDHGEHGGWHGGPGRRGGRGRGWSRQAMELSGRGWGGGRRVRRGIVRQGVLAVLAEGPAHGYDIIKALEERSGGRWRPSPGSIYPLLQMLEDAGLVRSEETGGKRIYQLTEEGRSEAASPAGGQFPWDGGDADSEREAALRAAVGQLHQAARQVASIGSPDQVERATEALRTARKGLYEILAED